MCRCACSALVGWAARLQVQLTALLAAPPSKVLLSNRADANAASDDGLTPLHKAAIEGHAAAAQVGGACDFALSGAWLFWWLSRCVATCFPQMLISYRPNASWATADVNRASVPDGFLPIHVAAYQGHASFVEVGAPRSAMLGKNSVAIQNSR